MGKRNWLKNIVHGKKIFKESIEMLIFWADDEASESVMRQSKLDGGIKISV